MATIVGIGPLRVPLVFVPSVFVPSVFVRQSVAICNRLSVLCPSCSLLGSSSSYGFF
jgi:hypothetical protein